MDFYCEDKELKEIITRARDIEPYLIHDSVRERVVDVCKLAVERFSGDICEIGAKTGLTTVLLAEIARKYSRKIIAVDPWELGVQDCYFGEYEEFINRMTPYNDILEIIRGKSQEEWVISALRQKTFSFVFIDALHYGWAIKGDIEIFKDMEGGIIAVDDVNHVWQDAMGGFMEGAKNIKKIPVHNPEHREGYLI